MIDQLSHRSRDVFMRIRWNENPRFARRSDYLRQRAAVAGDDRTPTRHRLEDGETERLGRTDVDQAQRGGICTDQYLLRDAAKESNVDT